jgi:hypothetical protein
MKRWWVHGTRYYSKDECDKQCKVLHPRLGIVESSGEVVDATDHDALIREARELAKKVIRNGQWEWELAQAFLDKTKEST